MKSIFYSLYETIYETIWVLCALIREFWIFPAGAALLALLMWGLIAEQKQWNQFKVEHECRIVGEQKGSIGTGISPKGEVVTVIEDDKTGWLCNDGVTYWR